MTEVYIAEAECFLDAAKIFVRLNPGYDKDTLPVAFDSAYDPDGNEHYHYKYLVSKNGIRQVRVANTISKLTF